MENGGQVYEETTVPTEEGKAPCWGHLTTKHLGKWRLCLKISQLDFMIVILVGSVFLLASIIFSGTSDKTPIEIAAVAFGYFASIAFLVDAVLMIKKRRVKKERQPENTTNPSNPPENQPLNIQQT
ncbi:CKLF-like MARVEL transmembrane domain-containing protein 6 isoform 2-T2 [Liasis olivaceus]